jgi:hypothetical protein
MGREREEDWAEKERQWAEREIQWAETDRRWAERGGIEHKRPGSKKINRQIV